MFWNPAAEVIFGYKKEEVMGEIFPLFLMPEKVHHVSSGFALRTKKKPIRAILPGFLKNFPRRSASRRGGNKFWRVAIREKK